MPSEEKYNWQWYYYFLTNEGVDLSEPPPWTRKPRAGKVLCARQQSCTGCRCIDRFVYRTCAARAKASFLLRGAQKLRPHCACLAFYRRRGTWNINFRGCGFIRCIVQRS